MVRAVLRPQSPDQRSALRLSDHASSMRRRPTSLRARCSLATPSATSKRSHARTRESPEPLTWDFRGWTQGIRTPDLLAASQNGLSGVLTCENAGRRRAESAKLWGVLSRYPTGRNDPLLGREIVGGRSDAFEECWIRLPHGPAVRTSPGRDVHRLATLRQRAYVSSHIAHTGTVARAPRVMIAARDAALGLKCEPRSRPSHSRRCRIPARFPPTGNADVVEGKLPEPDQVDGIGPQWKPATIERWAEREWWETRRWRRRPKGTR
jgi:hypothetical protein